MINNRGSASAFLVFLFAILLGAIGVLLECSRYKSFKVCTQDMLDASGKSIMTEYYRPLYDDYHLFFMAFSEGEDKQQYIKSRAQEYMQYSINPVKDLSVLKKTAYKKAFPIPQECSVEASNLVTALDNGGRAFEDEAVAYIKYKSVDKLIEKLRGAIDATNELKSSTKVVEEKMKCEEKLSQYSYDVIKLMELIDGVTVNDKGKIHIRNSFVKKLLLEKPTMNSVGVNNQQLWTKLKNKYVNVNQLLTEIRHGTVDVQSLLDEQVEIEEERNLVEREEEKNKDKKQRQRQQELDKRAKEISERIEEDLEKMKKRCKRFSDLVQEVQVKTDEAKNLADKLQVKEKALKSQMNQYKAKLNAERPDMPSDLSMSLSSDVQHMESITATGLNVNGLSNLLEQNAQILTSIDNLESVHLSASYTSMQRIQQVVMTNLTTLQCYHTDSIVFEYGNISGEEVDSPITKMKQMLDANILNLVLPDDVKVSQKKLEKVILSEVASEEEDMPELKDVMSHLDLMEGVSGLFNIFGEKEKIEIGENGNLVNSILMLFYQEEHFGSFINLEQEQKEKSLFYELEYIVKGKRTDKENLSGVIDEMVLWRMIFNFISIISDSEKKALAKETAIALAGITGIEPLIHITETLILLVWSFDEALVDVAGILQNKEIKVLKKGKDFVVSYPELLIMNHKLIQEKASSVGSLNKSGISYYSFLEILSLIKSNEKGRYRSMELINQNVVLRHCKGFHFKNCIYSFHLSANAVTDNKFLFLQFGNKTISEKDCNWTYQTTLEQSY